MTQEDLPLRWSPFPYVPTESVGTTAGVYLYIGGPQFTLTEKDLEVSSLGPHLHNVSCDDSGPWESTIGLLGSHKISNSGIFSLRSLHVQTQGWVREPPPSFPLTRILLVPLIYTV